MTRFEFLINLSVDPDYNLITLVVLSGDNKLRRTHKSITFMERELFNATNTVQGVLVSAEVHSGIKVLIPHEVHNEMLDRLETARGFQRGPFGEDISSNAQSDEPE